MSRKKFTVIIIPSAAVLIALLFIPTDWFFGIDSYNEESPSPIMVLENTDVILMGFKITPIGYRETSSGLTESQFQISNNNENKYEITIEVSFTDNGQVLFEKQVNLMVLSGQTIDQNHLSDDKYDNPVCVVKIVNWSEI